VSGEDAARARPSGHGIGNRASALARHALIAQAGVV